MSMISTGCKCKHPNVMCVPPRGLWGKFRTLGSALPWPGSPLLSLPRSRCGHGQVQWNGYGLLLWGEAAPRKRLHLQSTKWVRGRERSNGGEWAAAQRRCRAVNMTCVHGTWRPGAQVSGGGMGSSSQAMLTEAVESPADFGFTLSRIGSQYEGRTLY